MIEDHVDRQRAVIHDLQGRIRMLEDPPIKAGAIPFTNPQSRAPGRMPVHRMPYSSTEATTPLGPPHPRHPPLTHPHEFARSQHYPGGYSQGKFQPSPGVAASAAPQATVAAGSGAAAQWPHPFSMVSEPAREPSRRERGTNPGPKLESHAELVAASMARVYRGPHETWQKPENLIDLVAEVGIKTHVPAGGAAPNPELKLKPLI